MKKIFALISLFTFSFLPILVISDVVGYTINATQTLKDGDTLVSANGTFELGFFTPGSSSLKYLSIRYHQLPDKTIAWVANRRVGINNSSGVLRLSENGTLILNNGKNQTSVWLSNTTRVARDPVAQLLDMGNLVVREMNDSNSENYLWQSFDYPGDTGLPGLKFGVNKKTGLDRSISNWKSSDDPSQGNYTYGIDITGLPQVVLKMNSDIQFRSGPWNGLQFSGMPEIRSNSLVSFTYVSNDEDVYLLTQVVNSSTLTRIYITPAGVTQWYIWTGSSWYLNTAALTDVCDTYGTCGAYGMCDNNNSPLCNCLNGFEPKNKQEWEIGTMSGGCVRKTELNCSTDGFQEIFGVKVPDTLNFTSNSTMNLDECRRLCLKNCSCTAYANLNVSGSGSGCLQWFGDLIDMRSFPESEQNIFFKLSAADLAATGGGNSSSKKTVGIAVGVSLSVAALIIGLAAFLIWRRKHRKILISKGIPKEDSNEDLDLPIFDLATIAAATNDFAFQNKLGEGGFGPVYKGKLKDGQEIAVKRLSEESRQGNVEFKNEVSHIAKLQHRNLVRLLGCCIEANEKMLIYEYMPNKSLDFFLFDGSQSMSFGWAERYHIIIGIARGLLYLHQDSRLRIIHRDLKQCVIR